MSKKKDRIIEDLEDQVTCLERDYEDLSAEYYKRCNELMALTPVVPEPPVKKLISKIKSRQPKYAGGVCLDLWPLSDWVRFSYKKFHPGQYFQICVGPIRIEWYTA